MNEEARQRWLDKITKHGAYVGGKESPEHYVWRTMLARCNNPNSGSWKYYGGKGIKVCLRWLDFINFLHDMGERPSSGHSLDRVDSNKDYSPENCRWATRSEQQKNKTSTKWYSNGEFAGTLVECASYVGISKELAHWRWGRWGTFRKGEDWWQLQKKP
jgi:hypothetical protein